jgi:hypothetical protein
MIHVAASYYHCYLLVGKTWQNVYYSNIYLVWAFLHKREIIAVLVQAYHITKRSNNNECLGLVGLMQRLLATLIIDFHFK